MSIPASLALRSLKQENHKFKNQPKLHSEACVQKKGGEKAELVQNKMIDKKKKSSLKRDGNSPPKKT